MILYIIFFVTFIKLIKYQIRNKNIKEKKERKEKLETKKDDQYFEEIIDIDENISKDFEFLSNAPISENDHFVFQSEKDWTVDISKYSEFFTIDLKTLSAAIEAIPFNNNVNIDTKYFTVSLIIYQIIQFNVNFLKKVNIIYILIYYIILYIIIY